METLKTISITSLLANLGVIAGLTFVGFELQQNNEFLEAESRFNHAQVRANFGMDQATSDKFAEARVKWLNGEELDALETFRVIRYYEALFTYWQWDYQESERGRIEAPIKGWKRRMENQADRAMWEEIKYAYTDEFVEFMDEQVLGI